ncbi:MAG: adaptor protein MecA [Defluviitaleaceae bacterium]|nr:adaptor protein MecA [Defluviitaleaceae bacterium]
MRIERLNDTQMRIILLTDDLAARNIHINELKQNSDKTRQLFHEIMQVVQEDGDFRATQLMMEARWEGDGQVIVTVTKLVQNNSNDGFDLCPAARSIARFKRAPYIENEEPQDDDTESHSIFSFVDMDTAANAAARLDFAGPSRLYKMEGRFYLWLQNETDDERTTPELETPLHEFGQKHVSGSLSAQYLEEHGEIVLAEGAVEKLRLYCAM